MHEFDLPTQTAKMMSSGTALAPRRRFRTSLNQLNEWAVVCFFLFFFHAGAEVSLNMDSETQFR